MEIINRPAPPSGLRHSLLYRMGLGPLLGHRLMLLTHTGRVTGGKRQAVIEAIQHDDDAYVAASGFGPRADWYRNVRAAPESPSRSGATPSGPPPRRSTPMRAQRSWPSTHRATPERPAGYARSWASP